MLPTIDLNDQFSGVPDKIRDIGTDRPLPPEVHSRGLERAQYPPPPPLGIGGASAHGLRLPASSLCNVAMGHGHATCFPHPGAFGATPPHKATGFKDLIFESSCGTDQLTLDDSAG